MVAAVVDLHAQGYNGLGVSGGEPLLYDGLLPLLAAAFTLTIDNLDELAAVVELAAAEGATTVQVHPLEEIGRASDDLAGAAPDDRELAYAFLEVARLRAAFDGAVDIHLDVADRESLRDRPEQGFAGTALPSGDDVPLAEVVAPLVIESDGTVVPIQHGFDRSYAIGNVTEERFEDAAARWRRCHQDRTVMAVWTRLAACSGGSLELCRRVHDEETSRLPGLPYFNWYGAVTRASAAFPATS